MLNRELLLNNIPAVEKWFYRDFLQKFQEGNHTSEQALLEELRTIPPSYQHEVVKGLGMLVGAEMLADPLHTFNYPLDSRFGERLQSTFSEAFYTGVGYGFAESLCKYWRRILPPEVITTSRYEKMITIEWERCYSLMSQIPESIYPLVRNGFEEELQSRHYLYAPIRKFLNAHFSSDLRAKPSGT